MEPLSTPTPPSSPSSLADGKVLVAREGAVGWITFNRPERHNALAVEMWAAIPQALDQLEADDAVRIIVLRGAGGKAFISGADISQFEERRATEEQRRHYSELSQRVQARYASLEKPLIAMIHGYCLGGGLRAALNADIRIASDDAQFGIPAGRLGIAYDFSSVQKLVEAVGASRAKEILFTARRFSAAEAVQMGLVSQVVSRDQLEPAVRELAATIARNAPLSTRAAKASVTEAVNDPEQRDIARCATLVERCFQSEDYVEGRRAFLEKRNPVFRGR
jgi:enoyl-CoA hydratase